MHSVKTSCIEKVLQYFCGTKQKIIVIFETFSIVLWYLIDPYLVEEFTNICSVESSSVQCSENYSWTSGVSTSLLSTYINQLLLCNKLWHIFQFKRIYSYPLVRVECWFPDSQYDIGSKSKNARLSQTMVYYL